MNALHVIVEGAKTSRLYSTLDLEYVRRFIRANMNNPDAAFRQQMCSCVKKVGTIISSKNLKNINSFSFFQI